MTARYSAVPQLDLRVRIPQMAHVPMVVLECAGRAGVDGGTVWHTSAYREREEGEKLSLHHFGAADDFDADGLSEKDERWEKWRDEIMMALGNQYDVLAHKVKGRGGMHIHVEFDPRQ